MIECDQNRNSQNLKNIKLEEKTVSDQITTPSLYFSTQVEIPASSPAQRRQRPLDSSLPQLDLPGSTSALTSAPELTPGPKRPGTRPLGQTLAPDPRKGNERARGPRSLGLTRATWGLARAVSFAPAARPMSCGPAWPASWGRSGWPAPRPAAPPAAQRRDSGRRATQSPGRLALRRRALTELAESAPVHDSCEGDRLTEQSADCHAPSSTTPPNAKPDCQADPQPGRPPLPDRPPPSDPQWPATPQISRPPVAKKIPHDETGPQLPGSPQLPDRPPITRQIPNCHALQTHGGWGCGW